MPSLRPTFLALALALASSTATLGATLPGLGATAATAAAAAAAAAAPTEVCIDGTPTTTAGYPISYYARTTPSSGAFVNGYQPEPSWSSQHLVGTYTFGVPGPVETGFAYAQYKCQYYCENMSDGGSFFVHADMGAQSRCECYDDLLDPITFVNSNQTLVGAWNAICKT